jgi:hypothetical protein
LVAGAFLTTARCFAVQPASGMMQFCNGPFSLLPACGTRGTAKLGCRFVAMINFEKSGQQTVIFHLQEAVVFQLQLYQ